MVKLLGAAEMSWDDAGNRTRGAKGLELRLAKGWNTQVSHENVSKSGEGNRNT